MATLDELKSALRETLESRGVLNQLKAQIRSEIFAALDDSEVPKPHLSDENLLINELIRDYLLFNGYQHTLSVFLPESGQPQSPPFDRAFLARELQVVEDYKARSVPLLYGIVKGLRSVEPGDSVPEAKPTTVPARRPEAKVYADEPEPLFFTK